MLCPYCGFEMESGYLQANYSVTWSTKVHPGSTEPMYDGDFYLLKANWMKNNVNVPSHFCPQCKVVITRPDKENLEKRIKKGMGVLG